MDRRGFLRAGAAVGLLGLAGCTGDGGDGGGGDGSDGGDGGGGEDSDPAGSPTDGGADTPAADREITVGPGGALRFDPAEATVEAGTTVRWVWEGDFHSVTPESQPDSADWAGTGTDTHDTGYTHTHTFETAGTYDYYCQPHRSSGMTGTLTVE
jgi:plastocyanin